MIKMDSKKKAELKTQHAEEVAEFIVRKPQYSEFLDGLRLSYQRLIVRVLDGGKSRSDAVKMKCLDCACWQAEEVEKCPLTNCALYNFRPYKEKS